MNNKKFIQKITLFTALIFTFSSLPPVTSLAESSKEESKTVVEPLENVLITDNLENVLSSEQLEVVSTDAKLDDYVLSDEFDLETEVENITSIQAMTDDQYDVFKQNIKEQAALSGIEDEEELKIFEQALIDFFDENSEIYNNLEAAQEKLENEIEDIVVNSSNETNNSVVAKMLVNTLSVQSADASIINVKGKIKVGVKFAGAVFNTAIGVAVGGGVGAIQAYIIKKGKKEAQRIFTKTVTSKLKAWGAKKLAVAVGASVTIALNYLDVGTQIAKQIDKRDSVPNNGWINIY